MNKPIRIISFSGGQTSAMMTEYLLRNKRDEFTFHIVFSNTGHEREKTLEFVNNCDKRWQELYNHSVFWIEYVANPIQGIGGSFKIVDYYSAYRNYKKNGIDPFEQMIKVYGIPNLMNPHCSRELKSQTIRSYCRGFLKLKKSDYNTYLGFRSDEPKRLNFKKAKKNNLIYMAELGNVTKGDVNKFWASMPFRLEIKSYEGNCILCWKKTDRKIFTLIIEGDEEVKAEIEWIKNIEKTYGRFIPQSRIKQDKGQNVVFFRKNRSIEQMILESKDLYQDELAIDESNLLFDANRIMLFDAKLDMGSGCEESCDAFS